MPNLDIPSEAKIAKELDYRRKQEQRVLEKMRLRALKELGRQDLSEFLVEDAEICYGLQELDYSRETLLLLFLVPLIHVDWINGLITVQQRRVYLSIAKQRGVI